ncbi:MAG: hypothetical protein Q9227_008691 [Pyrenula ochraceoflavens]
MFSSVIPFSFLAGLLVSTASTSPILEERAQYGVTFSGTQYGGYAANCVASNVVSTIPSRSIAVDPPAKTGTALFANAPLNDATTLKLKIASVKGPGVSVYVMTPACTSEFDTSCSQLAAVLDQEEGLDESNCVSAPKGKRFGKIVYVPIPAIE